MGKETVKETLDTNLDTKAVLKEQVGNKVNLSDRMNLEIIKETKFYSVGQKIQPHRVIGEDLVKNEIAKELK